VVGFDQFRPHSQQFFLHSPTVFFVSVSMCERERERERGRERKSERGRVRVRERERVCERFP
jgi:hypothetical protein